LPCFEIRNFATSFFFGFGSPSNQSNSHTSHHDTFIFSKVNPLTVPRVDQALALMHPVFDHFALVSEIISSILE
jgi:hypothetical protein